RRDRQAERRAARPRRRCRTEHGPALVRRTAPVRLELALLVLGQPVLSRDALLAAPDHLRPERRNGDRPRLLRRPSRPPRPPRAGTRDAAPKRRLHNGDLPMTLAHIAGLPIEESLATVAPAASILAGLGRARPR